MEKKQVGGRIRQLRELQHYTREALAEKIEVSPKFLYEIENGRKGFSAEVLCRISCALSASCDYILFGEDKSHQGMENIMYVLENTDSIQLNRMRTVLKMLSEVCE